MKSDLFDIRKLNQYYANNNKIDTGFRLINTYLPEIDQIATRIDIKIENRQYATGFISSTPIKAKDGDKISPFNDLISPPGFDCFNLKVNKKDLINSLRELAYDLEQDDKAQ